MLEDFVHHHALVAHVSQIRLSSGAGFAAATLPGLPSAASPRTLETSSRSGFGAGSCRPVKNATAGWYPDQPSRFCAASTPGVFGGSFRRRSLSDRRSRPAPRLRGGGKRCEAKDQQRRGSPRSPGRQASPHHHGPNCVQQRSSPARFLISARAPARRAQRVVTSEPLADWGRACKRRYVDLDGRGGIEAATHVVGAGTGEHAVRAPRSAASASSDDLRDRNALRRLCVPGTASSAPRQDRGERVVDAVGTDRMAVMKVMGRSSC